MEIFATVHWIAVAVGTVVCCKKNRYAINVGFFYILASGFVMIACLGIFRAIAIG